MTLMAKFAGFVAEATENEQFDADRVSPGVGGFIVIAVLGIALFFLGLDLVRRLRRAKYRAEIHQELAAELAERDAASAASAASAAAGDSTGSDGANAAVDRGAEAPGTADPRPDDRT